MAAQITDRIITREWRRPNATMFVSVPILAVAVADESDEADGRGGGVRDVNAAVARLLDNDDDGDGVAMYPLAEMMDGATIEKRIIWNTNNMQHINPAAH